MIVRSIITALIICIPLTGQSLPELRDYQGKYQGVIVHRLDVEPKATLHMKALRGDIVLMGTDVQRIVIEEKITVKTKHKDEAQEIIERIQGELSPPSASGEAYIFKVGKVSNRNVSFHYKTRVPKTFNVIIHSYGGNVDMSDLQGDLETKTGGGDIALSNSAGRVKAHTGGGDIDVFKVEGQVDLFTGGGDIEGRTVEGRISASTGAGDIDFWTSKGNFTINTGGGDIDLRSLEGTSVEARTGGGDIDIADVSAQANLMTGGGDISAENLTGGVEAASSGGNLSLERIHGDAILFSASGDIDIRRITGAVRAKSGSGDIEIYEMVLEEPGKEESTLTTSTGDVYVNYYSKRPVDITAKVFGYSPRYAVDRISGNVDFTYKKDNGNTLATYSTDRPFHSIVIETTTGEIKIMKGEQ
ncbi:MAG: DUF4097 family beta strand repeat protein [Fidelibacterota bacterium]|nr:MAG: DUF4097 family beta strand repeat protein [Candidatus Neomarinimicrobiota bacterium]